MTKDLNSVFDGLGGEISKTPIDFNVDAVTNGAIPTQAQGGGFKLELHIDTFINNTSEDIESLTEEIMETADSFARRKGLVFGT